MRPIELAALKFWNAAVFIRRAPDRNQSIARRLLHDVAVSDFQPIRDRAVLILKEITDDRELASPE